MPVLNASSERYFIFSVFTNKGMLLSTVFCVKCDTQLRPERSI